MNNSSIYYFNRSTNAQEEEKIYGDGAIRFFYESEIGKKLGPILASRFISKAYGVFQDTALSGMKVPKFVNKFNIPIDDYVKGTIKSQSFENSFKSFNEFFIRQFQEGKRKFIIESEKMPAFCEARYFGYKNNTADITLPVKGHFLKPSDLLLNSKWGKSFENGPILVARLCPVDYHRYHYPDNGQTLESYNCQGDLHSVNPLALKVRSDIMIKNERRVAILETKNFKKLAYIEVGATCVGKIVQSHDERKAFQRGDEKGYFLFGGSTVILLGEPGSWHPSEDIMTNTNRGIETLVQLGEEIAIQTK